MLKNRSWTAPGTRWGLLLTVFVLVVAGLSGSATPSVAAPPMQGGDGPLVVIELPPEALEGPIEGAHRPADQPDTKIESALNDLIVALKTPQADIRDMLEPGNEPYWAEGLVHAQIVLDPSALPAIREAIVQAGGEVTGASYDETLIQCWLPIDAVDQIVSLPGVYKIRRPAEAILLEPALGTASTTEALAAMNATGWHANGQIGAGIRVGVIDMGFMNYADLIGTDLPLNIEARNFVDGENLLDVDGTTQHGTACAEIIYDVAPGVSLYLAKINTNLDLQDAVAWLREQNVDVISTSLAWYDRTPGDGTGEFADLVQAARDDGIVWVTAAGNERENHWGGTYVDIAPGNDANDRHAFLPNGVNCFGPEGGGCYAIPPGEVLNVYLRWDDDWARAGQDYDLYLVRLNGTTWQTVASSYESQEGDLGDTPVERITNYVTQGDTAFYGVAIDRFFATRDVNLELFTPKAPGLSERLAARSLGNLADAPAAITVAALDAYSPFRQEVYSSEGPTNGPGGTAEGGFIKPDIAAYANVSVESYGVRGFDGTSAATPHVAGAAALVLGLYPHYTPDQVQAFLQENAVDMGDPGQDTAFGYGRLYLGEHLAAPEVTSISPNSGLYTGAIHVTNLSGDYFRPGASVHLSKSNHDPIAGTNVAWVDQNTLTLDLDLTGAANGAWDVVVTNPDGKSGSLQDGFTVVATETAPRVFSISPTSSAAEVIQATVTGQDFATGGEPPTVALTQVGQAAIVATDVVVVDSSELTCQFDLTEANGGLWNLVVTNPNDDYWVLSEAYTVLSYLHLPYLVNNYPPPPDPLFAVEDTMVIEGDPLANYGQDTDMWVGLDDENCYIPPRPGLGVGRALVKFDTSTIAPGTPIPQATLYLYLGYSCDVPGIRRIVTVHRVTSFWSSGTVNWTTQPIYGEAISAVELPPRDEATNRWYAFDVTELVRGWVNRDYLNLGLEIIGPEDLDDGARLGFITSDYLGGAYAPRILFSYSTQASEAELLESTPLLQWDCLPALLFPADEPAHSSRFTSAPTCPAD